MDFYEIATDAVSWLPIDFSSGVIQIILQTQEPLRDSSLWTERAVQYI